MCNTNTLTKKNQENMENDYEWEKEVEIFEKTKGGVKGLVDSGITEVPRFFIRPSWDSEPPKTERVEVKIPVIDLEGMERSGRRVEIIDEIRKASESLGFFQTVNHGVPMSVMEGILESTRRFHEQPKEEKMELYSPDRSREVRFYTMNGIQKRGDMASFRDAFACSFKDGILDPNLIPSLCRNEIGDYMKYMKNLRDVLSELLSEALGVRKDVLEQLQCMKNEYLACIYYPPSPQPDITFGTVPHSDPTILTILVQDQSGGLQINNDGQWVDVPPIPGALILNIGDLLQIISNDKFKSVEHRVLATSKSKSRRVSAACFFSPGSEQRVKAYGPIKELVSKDNAPVYREVSYIEYVAHYDRRSVPAQYSALSNFRL